MKRRGFTLEAIAAIRRAYKVLYRSGLTLEEARLELTRQGELHAEVRPFVDFIAQSTRGLIR